MDWNTILEYDFMFYLNRNTLSFTNLLINKGMLPSLQFSRYQLLSINPFVMCLSPNCFEQLINFKTNYASETRQRPNLMRNCILNREMPCNNCFRFLGDIIASNFVCSSYFSVSLFYYRSFTQCPKELPAKY